LPGLNAEIRQKVQGYGAFTRLNFRGLNFRGDGTHAFRCGLFARHLNQLIEARIMGLILLVVVLLLLFGGGGGYWGYNRGYYGGRGHGLIWLVVVVLVLAVLFGAPHYGGPV
jgi:hypothetical protein